MLDVKNIRYSHGAVQWYGAIGDIVEITISGQSKRGRSRESTGYASLPCRETRSKPVVTGRDKSPLPRCSLRRQPLGERSGPSHGTLWTFRCRKDGGEDAKCAHRGLD